MHVSCVTELSAWQQGSMNPSNWVSGGQSKEMAQPWVELCNKGILDMVYTAFLLGSCKGGPWKSRWPTLSGVEGRKAHGPLTDGSWPPHWWHSKRFPPISCTGVVAQRRWLGLALLAITVLDVSKKVREEFLLTEMNRGPLASMELQFTPAGNVDLWFKKN